MTLLKCIIFDVVNTVWYGYAGQCVAMSKCSLADAANTVAYDHAAQSIAIRECGCPVDRAAWRDNSRGGVN